MKLLASEAHRWYNCPGSLNLAENLPKDFKVNFYEDKKTAGKIAHEIAEIQIKDFIAGKRQKSFVSLIKKYEIEKSSDEYFNIKHASEFYVKYIKDFYGKQQKQGKTKILIEVKNKMKILDNDCTAQADTIVITKTKLGHSVYIFDLKTGNFNYEESAFCQLDFTSFFIKEFLPGFEGGTISSIVIQPNYHVEDLRVIKEAKVGTYEDLMEECHTRIKGAESRELYPGSHCNFCPALSICPIMQNTSEIIMAKSQIQEVDKKLETYRKFFEFIHLNRKAIENYLKTIDEILIKDMQAGVQYDNIMVGSRAGHRKWKNEDEVKEKLKYLKEDLFDTKLKSPAQIEKIAGKKNIEDLYYQPEYPKIIKRKSEFGEIE